MTELAGLFGLANIFFDDDNAIVDQPADTEEESDLIHENRTCVLKLSTTVTEKNQKSFKLSLPKSRISRNFSNLKSVKKLEGFRCLVQEQYNKCPVGVYAGP